MKSNTTQPILEILCFNSGTPYVAREISFALKHGTGNSPPYRMEASPKSVSKTIRGVEDDYDMLHRVEADKMQRGRYNCRYIYCWGDIEISNDIVLHGATVQYEDWNDEVGAIYS
jgi:hypothetical protein